MLLELQKENEARIGNAASDALKKITPESKSIGDSKEAVAVPKDSKNG